MKAKIVVLSETHQKKFGGNIEKLQERVGGPDHQPIFKVTITTQIGNFSAEGTKTQATEEAVQKALEAVEDTQAHRPKQNVQRPQKRRPQTYAGQCGGDYAAWLYEQGYDPEKYGYY